MVPEGDDLALFTEVFLVLQDEPQEMEEIREDIMVLLQKHYPPC